MSGNNQTAAVGEATALPLTARVVASTGQGIPGSQVTFAVTAGGGSLTHTVATSDENGVVQTTWTLGTSVSEGQRVEASVASGGGAVPLTAVFSATPRAGPPAVVIKIAGDRQSLALGAMPSPLSLEVRDRFENPVPNAPVTWALTEGAGTLASSGGVTDAQGVVSARMAQPSLGRNVVQATVTGLDPVAFDVSVGLHVRLVLESVTAGYFYSCGIAVGGAAYCWGSNASGEIGDGSSGSGIAPSPVPGGLSFAALSAGVWQTCGVTTDQRLYCWGTNPGAIPVRVAEGMGFTEVSVGLQHSCGLTMSGAAYCWGDNSLGALGTGDRTGHTGPAAVTGGHTFISIAAGWHYTCGVATDGSAFCWGKSGGLGFDVWGVCEENMEDVYFCVAQPTRVETTGRLTRIGTGERGTCALRTDGKAECWGSFTAPETGFSTTPSLVPGANVFITLDVDAHRACGTGVDGRVLCWGYIPEQQHELAREPAPVAGNLVFRAVSVGWFHTCGITTNGATYCWGSQ